MKPHIKLAETRTPEGATLTLFEHDGSYSIRLNGQALMHSMMHASELALGELATAKVGKAGAPRILIGGLGLGFTLRSVLQRVSAKARVSVAELLPEIVAWNREHMACLNGSLLNDPRVEVVVGDVGKLIGNARGPGRYDAILLDIDNGPTALVRRGNQHLYDEAGIQRLVTALGPGGRAAIWSAT
jgi:spermidine synthase